MKRRQELSSSLGDDLHVFELAQTDAAVDEILLLERIKQVRGVQRAEYNAARGRLLVLGAIDRAEVLAALQDLGLAQAPPSEEPAEAPARAQAEPQLGPKRAPLAARLRARIAANRRTLLTLAVLLPLSFFLGVALSVVSAAPLPRVGAARLLGAAVAVAAALAAAAQILFAEKRAGEGVSAWRPDTALLTVVVVVALGVAGDWSGAALLCLAVWAVQGLPWLLFRRLQRSFHAVQERLPDQVRLIDGDEVRLVSRADAAPGSRIRVEQGEAVPLDGRVAAGEAAVDPAAVTGEEIPFAPAPGDVVLAGSTVLSGSLDLEVLRPADASWLALARPREIWERVAQDALPGRVAGLLRRWPQALVYAATVFMVLPTLVLGEAVEPWMRRALALLVVAPVNTLVLAWVAPHLMARLRTAQEGGLSGSAALVFGLGRVQRVAVTADALLDPRCALGGVEPLAGLSAEAALRLAASVASHWDHPMGRAVREAAERDGLKPMDPVSTAAVAGLGVRAVLGDHGAPAEYLLGLTVWMRAEGVALPAAAEQWIAMAAREGGTILWLARDGEAVAALMIEQRVRDGVRRLMGRIRRGGVRHVTLTGPYDRPCVERWAEQAGVEEALPELVPTAAGEAAAGWREAGEAVAAVVSAWDGPEALAAADIRLVLSEGLDTAPQANTLLLPVSDPSKVFALVRLGRRARRAAHFCVAVAVAVKAAQAVAALAAAPAPWLLAAADAAAVAALLGAALNVLRRA